MKLSRFGFRFVFAGFALSLLAGACGTDEDDNDCDRGEEDCRCNRDGTCDDGLVCNEDERCEEPASGAGGSAGRGGSGGKGGTAGKGGTGGSTGGSFTGGTGGSVTGGTGGTSATGGTGGTGGSTGGTGGSAGTTSGTGGTAGTTAGTTGEGGTSGEGGAGGAVSEGGEGGESTAGTGGTAGGGMGGMGGSAGTACTEISFSNVHVEWPEDEDYVVVTGDVSPELGTADFDVFGLEFWGAGQTATGTFQLGQGIDSIYDTCERCLLLFQDFNEDANSKSYFASAGTLVLDGNSDVPQGRPRGTLTNVTLREAIFSDEGMSWVSGGACLHLASAILDADQTPSGWTCEPTYFDDGDCDCGCGAPDVDCLDGTASSCEYCWCPGDNGSCAESPALPSQAHLCSAG